MTKRLLTLAAAAAATLAAAVPAAAAGTSGNGPFTPSTDCGAWKPIESVQLRACAILDGGTAVTGVQVRRDPDSTAGAVSIRLDWTASVKAPVGTATSVLATHSEQSGSLVDADDLFTVSATDTGIAAGDCLQSSTSADEMAYSPLRCP